jgi:integrase
MSAQKGSSMKIALTSNEVVAALTLPAGVRELKFFDHGHRDCVVGFGLRIRDTGSRVWVFQYKYGDKHNRMKLGTWPALSLEKARGKARKYREDVDDGGNPAAKRAESRQRSTETFGRIAARYLERRKPAMKPRSYTEVERYLNKHAKPLHGLLLGGIDRRRVAGLLSEIGDGSGVVAANRVRASLSALFAWAIREGILDANVVIGTNRSDEAERDRVLSEAELREISAALLDDDYGAIVRLLMLTGQRREELGGLRWSEIDFDRGVIVFPAARTKNKREHEIPMSNPVREILESRDHKEGRDLVFGKGKGPFAGWSNAKETLDARLLIARKAILCEKAKVLADWRLHDIRRTVATRMNDLGVQPHVVEAVLNHISGSKAGVAGIYNRSSYVNEKKAALDLWGAHVEALVAAGQVERKQIARGAKVFRFPAQAGK